MTDINYHFQLQGESVENFMECANKRYEVRRFTQIY